MVYHAQSDIPGIAALVWGAKYLVLCSGIKSLVSNGQIMRLGFNLLKPQIMVIDDILDYGKPQILSGPSLRLKILGAS